MIKLCSISDLSGDKQLFSANGEAILVVRDGDRIYAVSSICPHAGGKLCNGRVEDGTITCMEHGLCFDLQDGSIRLDQVDEDLLDMIDPDNLPFGPLQTFETVIEDGDLYLRLPAEPSR